jgi:hypothetical protein
VNGLLPEKTAELPCGLDASKVEVFAGARLAMNRSEPEKHADALKACVAWISALATNRRLADNLSLTPHSLDLLNVRVFSKSLLFESLPVPAATALGVK